MCSFWLFWLFLLGVRLARLAEKSRPRAGSASPVSLELRVLFPSVVLAMFAVWQAQLAIVKSGRGKDEACGVEGGTLGVGGKGAPTHS